MKLINMETWPRRAQYKMFRHMTQPHLSITADVDVSHLMADLKPQGFSIFNAVLYAILHAANLVPEFKTRFREDKVVLHDVINASITVPIENEQFAFCEIDYQQDWPLFNQACIAKIAKAKQQNELAENIDPGNDSWIFTSCIPWIKFSAMNNPLSGKDDCIPRIVWGKISQDKDGRWAMPVAVETHHALVDGIHMAKFFTILEKTLAEL